MLCRFAHFRQPWRNLRGFDLPPHPFCLRRESELEHGWSSMCCSSVDCGALWDRGKCVCVRGLSVWNMVQACVHIAPGQLWAIYSQSMWLLARVQLILLPFFIYLYFKVWPYPLFALPFSSLFKHCAHLDSGEKAFQAQPEVNYSHLCYWLQCHWNDTACITNCISHYCIRTWVPPPCVTDS